ncbi:MAG: DUF1684 domain-containing protein [Chitinophagaceae bacterium]|nr:DUF1684 domain-containing protein [Anaerolineae bacterium]
MLDLLDYRRRVSQLYHTVREANGDSSACDVFRKARDELFHTHSQSALDEIQKAAFSGLLYYDYDPGYRVVARVNRDVEPETLYVELGEDGNFAYRRFGRVTFELPTGKGALSLFWITGYGGGVFLPLGDSTNNQTTYGGGRYLYDTIKGADLGTTLDEIVLDFNYAYNPSCAYNPHWVCPLSPPENRLTFPIVAGEKI